MGWMHRGFTCVQIFPSLGSDCAVVPADEVIRCLLEKGDNPVEHRPGRGYLPNPDAKGMITTTVIISQLVTETF